VLAVDPFHGGSHREFLRGVVTHSRHQWTLLAGKPVHWKWRMRSAPLELAKAARDAIDTSGYPELAPRECLYESLSEAVSMIPAAVQRSCSF
jgi:hypothetical protein